MSLDNKQLFYNRLDQFRSVKHNAAFKQILSPKVYEAAMKALEEGFEVDCICTPKCYGLDWKKGFPEELKFLEYFPEATDLPYGVLSENLDEAWLYPR